jgi:DoxX-like family
MTTTALDHAPAAPAKGSLWTGRILTGLLAVLLLFDVAMKIAPPPSVRAQSAQMGFAPAMLAGIGVVLLVSLVIYLVPRTSVLGAILLTGYLGGAVATNLHGGMCPGLILFPAVVGVLVWGGLWLRDRRLRALIPLRPGRAG